MGWASRLAKGAGRPKGGGGKSEATRFIPVRVVTPSPAKGTDDSLLFAAEVILESGRRVRLGEFRLHQLGLLLDALEGGRAC